MQHCLIRAGSPDTTLLRSWQLPCGWETQIPAVWTSSPIRLRYLRSISDREIPAKNAPRDAGTGEVGRLVARSTHRISLGST